MDFTDPRLAGAAFCGGAAVLRLLPGFSLRHKAHRQDRGTLCELVQKTALDPGTAIETSWPSTRGSLQKGLNEDDEQMGIHPDGGGSHRNRRSHVGFCDYLPIDVRSLHWRVWYAAVWHCRRHPGWGERRYHSGSCGRLYVRA